MAWWDFLNAAASAGGGAGGGAAIPAGGGTAAGGGAFDAGVMATHGGMSNAAGGAGDPKAYAGAPADEMDPKMAEMFKNLGALGAVMLGGGGEEAPQRVIPAMRGQAGSPAVFQPSVAPSNAGFYNQIMKMLGK